MKVKIDIDRGLTEQFAVFFGLDENLIMDPAIGTGGPVRYLSFPGEMELYHFPAARFAVPISMKSVNPEDSDWFLVHINLSAFKQRKAIAGQSFEFHKSLPIGLLIYGPGLEIDTDLPQGVDVEVATIRFSTTFLRSYFEDWQAPLAKPLISEDLDYLAEQKLSKALACMDDKIGCHSAVLRFLGHIFRKLQSHEHQQKYVRLRQNEIDGLFRACAALRVLSATESPKLDELAALANMGRTKFNSLFKQVFGSTPMQYRTRYGWNSLVNRLPRATRRRQRSVTCWVTPIPQISRLLTKSTSATSRRQYGNSGLFHYLIGLSH